MPNETLENDQNGNLYSTYQRSIAELFNKAESRNLSQLFLCLMPPPRELPIPAGGMLYEVPDMEIEEAFETHRCLDQAMQDEHIDPRTRTRLMLIVTFHLIEADRWHSILGNILNIFLGCNYVTNLFQDDALGEKINGMRRLLKKCEKSGICLSIAKTYSEVCNDDVRELRNAFLHSHYTLAPEGDLLITKRLMGKQRGFKNYYQVNDIRDIHRRTVTFLTVLAETRKGRLRRLRNRRIDLNHEIDWIETKYRGRSKSCETRYMLKGSFGYLVKDGKWRFRGRLHVLEDNH